MANFTVRKPLGGMGPNVEEMDRGAINDLVLRVPAMPPT